MSKSTPLSKVDNRQIIGGIGNGVHDSSAQTVIIYS